MKGFTGVIFGGALLIGAAMTAGPALAASTPATSTMTVKLGTSLSLALYAEGDDSSELSNLEFELDPTGVLVAKGVIARVSTNAPKYLLTLQMSGSVTDLVQENVTRQIVGTVTDNVTASTMKENSWGYSIDATNFSKVPANGSPATIKEGTKTTTDADAEAYEDTTITFGVKVDGAIAAGTYTNSVVVTAIPQDVNEDEIVDE